MYSSVYHKKHLEHMRGGCSKEAAAKMAREEAKKASNAVEMDAA